MKTPRLCALSLIFAAAIAGACPQERTAAPADPPPGEATEVNQPLNPELQLLQGIWEGFSLSQETPDGPIVKETDPITVTITGNSLHFHRDANFWFETTITLLSGTKPQQLHATIKRGSNSIGEVVAVIFKIEDGTLTLATDNGAGEAMKIFETAPNRYELRRVQPQEKLSGSGLDSLFLQGPDLHASLKTRQLDAVRHVPRAVVPANPHHSTDADFVEAIARSGSQGSLGREGIRSALYALYLGETELGFYGLEATSEEVAKQREEAVRRIWSHNVSIGRAQIHRQGLVIVVVWNDGVSPECWKAVNAKVAEQLAKENAGEQLTASPLSTAEPRTLPGLGLTLMPIPAGTFTMGSLDRNDRDTPLTLVTISQPFWLGRTEVTQGQWKALMDTDVVEQVRRQLAEDRLAGKQRSYREGDRAKVKNPAELVRDTADDAPMYWVSWEEAVAFCRRLTERERAEGRVPAGYEYRLPTDAEWEYAARADTTTMTGAGGTEFKGSASAPAPDPITWYRGHSGEGLTGKSMDPSAPEKPFPGDIGEPRDSASKRSNAWGLYDLRGNMSEWCGDWYSPELPGGSVQDPTGPTVGVITYAGGPGRVFRSGVRLWQLPGQRESNLGFRVALAPRINK